MRILSITIFFYAVSLTSSVAGGRDSVFTHLLPRKKELGETEFRVFVTGKENGLQIQGPAGSNIVFDGAVTFVLTPEKKRIALRLSALSNVEKGRFLAEFSKAYQMTKGVYKYVIVINISGEKHEFSHSIEYRFKNIAANRSKGKQVELP